MPKFRFRLIPTPDLQLWYFFALLICGGLTYVVAYIWARQLLAAFASSALVGCTFTLGGIAVAVFGFRLTTGWSGRTLASISGAITGFGGAANTHLAIASIRSVTIVNPPSLVTKIIAFAVPIVLIFVCAALSICGAPPTRPSTNTEAPLCNHRMHWSRPVRSRPMTLVLFATLLLVVAVFGGQATRRWPLVSLSIITLVGLAALVMLYASLSGEMPSGRRGAARVMVFAFALTSWGCFYIAVTPRPGHLPVILTLLYGFVLLAFAPFLEKTGGVLWSEITGATPQPSESTELCDEIRALRKELGELRDELRETRDR